MSRLFTCGGETASATSEGLSTSGTTPTFDTSIKRTGNYSIRCAPASGGTSYVSPTITNALGRTVYLRGYYYFTTFPASGQFNLIMSLSGANIGVTSAGILQVRNNALTQLGSNGPTLSLNTWYRIEMAVLVNTGSVDVVEARLEDVPFVSLTGQALSESASTTPLFGITNAATGSAPVVYVDDIAVNDDTDIVEMPHVQGGSSNQQFADVDSRNYIAVMSRTSGGSLKTAIVTLMKTGTPTDNVVVEIRKSHLVLSVDGRPKPDMSASGLLGSQTFAGTSLTTSLVARTFTFSPAIPLEKDSDYFVVLSRSGALNTSNYYNYGMNSESYQSEYNYSGYDSGSESWAGSGSGSNMTYTTTITSYRHSSWAGPGRVYFALALADSNRGANWTAGAGGTTNLAAAVNNTPPVGVVLASATNTSQVKNVAKDLVGNYSAYTQPISDLFAMRSLNFSPSSATATARIQIGSAAASAGAAEQFILKSPDVVRVINIIMNRIGTLTDNIVCKIVGDTGGLPNATVYATQTSAGSGVSNAANGANVAFTFDQALPAGTYWVTITRSGSNDGANYGQVIAAGAAENQTKSAVYNSGTTTWSVGQNRWYYNVGTLGAPLDRCNVCQAIAVIGGSNTTMNLGITSFSPSLAEVTGNVPGTIAGTYPTGWGVLRTNPFYIASPADFSTATQITLRKNTNSTNAAMVALMGFLFEIEEGLYQHGTTVPPVKQQAVARAAYW